jgi:hypothetical protein
MYEKRIATQWNVYIAQHMNTKGIKLKMQEWATKLINALWDHTTCVWHCHNDAVHIRDTNQVFSSRSTHWRERRTESKTNARNCDTRYMTFNQGVWKGWYISNNYITTDRNAGQS